MFATYSPENGASLPALDTSMPPSTSNPFSGVFATTSDPFAANNYPLKVTVPATENSKSASPSSISINSACESSSNSFTIFGYTMTYETAAIIAVIVIVLLLIFR